MKTLEQYRLIKEFMSSQGIQPTASILASSEDEWKDMHYLAQEWKDEIDAEIAAREAELDGLSEEEIGIREQLEREKEQYEKEALLFHSSGYKPGSK